MPVSSSMTKKPSTNKISIRFAPENRFLQDYYKKRARVGVGLSD
jgi:hypothetical protein